MGSGYLVCLGITLGVYNAIIVFDRQTLVTMVLLVESCKAGFIEEVDGSGRPIGLCWQIFPDETLTYAEATATCRSRSRNGQLLALDTALKRHRVQSALRLKSLSGELKCMNILMFDFIGKYFSTDAKYLFIYLRCQN